MTGLRRACGVRLLRPSLHFRCMPAHGREAGCHYEPDRSCIQVRCTVGAIERQVAVLASKATDEEWLKARVRRALRCRCPPAAVRRGSPTTKGQQLPATGLWPGATSLHALWDTGTNPGVARCHDGPECRAQKRERNAQRRTCAQSRTDLARTRIIFTVGLEVTCRAGRPRRCRPSALPIPRPDVRGTCLRTSAAGTANLPDVTRTR